MRSPEHRQTAPPRAGRNFEDELHLHYLSPGAFTILPPEHVPPPDPPAAPNPYRLTPTSRRHKNHSFSIIAEPTASRPGSRSSSPSGRVSPFRGHGFNPTGSRHASPSPSPPPEDVRLTPTNRSPKRTSSKIPRSLSRRGSQTFGDKVSHIVTPSTRHLNNQLSQSLTSLENTSRNVPNRPPKKHFGHHKPAFQQLSPIVGSSPEPSQSLSSPSRIPKSKSQPGSRLTSPIRNPSNLIGKPPVPTSKVPSRNTSRNASRNASRNVSREPSPSKGTISPTRIPSNRYKNVQAKVNSYNKPKVPNNINNNNNNNNPSMVSELSTEESDANTRPSRLIKRDSVKKLRTNSQSNLLPKTYSGSTSNLLPKTTAKPASTTNLLPKTNSYSNSNLTDKKNNNNNINNSSNNISASNNNKTSTSTTKTNTNTNKPKSNLYKSNSKSNLVKPVANNNSSNKPKSKPKNNTENNEASTKNNKDKTTTNTNTSEDENSNLKKSASAVKLSDLLPSTTAVVSSTTTTVTQPLKIDANIPLQFDKPKPVSPMVDGRVLSATSVSNAMNRMNDTVLNTQTLIKDHNSYSKVSAASAIVSIANEKKDKPNGENKNITKELPTAEASKTTKDASTNNNTKQNNSSSNGNSNSAKHSTNNGNSKPQSANNTSNNGNTTTSKPNNNHISHVGIMDSKALEKEVQNNMNKLISPGDHVMGNSVQKSVNERIKEARTVVAADVKPIRITVKEKPSGVDVESGNIRPIAAVNGTPGLPPTNATPPNEQDNGKPPPKTNLCTNFLTSCKNKMSCKSCKKDSTDLATNVASNVVRNAEEEVKSGCFNCRKKKERKPNQVRINIEPNESDPKPRFLDRLKCCGKANKVGNTTGCFSKGKRKPSWNERRDSILSSPHPTQGSKCGNILRTMFCLNAACCKKKTPPIENPASRKQSIISKKKSLTPTTLPPPEEVKPKLDISMVEHTSHMKGAIPVLPISLAWFCLVMNCIGPGTGTVLSGLFCLCLGIPRFSQKDGAKQRIGAFIINIFIGAGQFFTVLFCLVGWGWSIWWGVIMLKMAKKYRKIKQLEELEEASGKDASTLPNPRDPERASN